MWVDGVFSGGGVRAFAYLGAIEAVEKANYQFKRVAGTSAGSIVASFLAAGFTYKEIHAELDKLDVQTFLDNGSRVRLPFLNWIGLYKNMGLYKGDTFENWVHECLKKKGIESFGDLPEGALTIIATDISNGSLLRLPEDLRRYGLNPETFLISKAVRMSCSIPFFFIPVTLKDDKGKICQIVDGGLISNFPIWVFKVPDQRLKRPYIGFQLGSENGNLEPRPIHNSFELFQNVVETLKLAHSTGKLSTQETKNVCFLPVDDINFTNFKLTQKEQNKLVQIGKETTRTFLRKWVPTHVDH